MKNYKLLFWVTIFVNSFLLFLIEPMINRMLLPFAGSSMSVWNIALMCFQIILLGGYIYVHYLPKFVGYKNYLKIHILLLSVSIIITFLFFKKPQVVINTNNRLWINFYIVQRLESFFLYYLRLNKFSKNGTTKFNESPLFYSKQYRKYTAKWVYYCYEVLLGLNHTVTLFNIIYTITAVISVIVVLNIYKSFNHNSLEETIESHDVKKEQISSNRILYWIILSFIPNALMIATNTILYNQINVNSIHYFWILPLMIFLTAYIIAFSKLKLLDTDIYERLALWACIMVLLLIFYSTTIFIYIISMFALFIICLVCNIYLVQDKPNASNLTEFYLYISIGGALGGVFSSIISPLIFNDVYEFPLMIAAFILLMFNKHRKDKILEFTVQKWEYDLVFLLLFIIIIINGISLNLIQLSYIIIIVLAYRMRRLYMFVNSRRNTIILLLVTTSLISFAMLRKVEYKERNFYGVKTITKSEYIDDNDNKHTIIHLISGNTVHGSQFSKGDEFEFEAISYYDSTGSTVGRFFNQNSNKINTVGVVGLGIGTLSALSNENQEWKYFEIDPQVIEIAQDEEYFTILNRFNHEVIISSKI